MKRVRKGIICTTTINEPTDAIRRYDAMEEWHLIVVGDKGSPKKYELARGEYLDWEYQKKTYPDLCEIVGANSVARGRLIAFIEAYKAAKNMNLPIIASIDDDCFPYDHWGERVYVGKKVEADYYVGDEICFNPIQMVPGGVWARGYPLQFAMTEKTKFVLSKNKQSITPLIQCDLCDGQMDLDAIERIARANRVAFKCDVNNPFFSTAMFSPINVQNTFFHREVIKDFCNFPFVGRADDIWGGYVFQSVHVNTTLYGPPSALHQQNRSVESLVRDMEEEMLMYRRTMEFLTHLSDKPPVTVIRSMLPRRTQEAMAAYRGYFS